MIEHILQTIFFENKTNKKKLGNLLFILRSVQDGSLRERGPASCSAVLQPQGNYKIKGDVVGAFQMRSTLLNIVEQDQTDYLSGGNGI